MKLLSLACGAVFGVVSTAAMATSFVIVNADDPGEGLNDTTPATPVGMNTGETLGAQRLAAIEAAADYWAARLDSAVPIHVYVRYQEGTCTPGQAFLATGAPVTFYSHTGDVLSLAVPAALSNAVEGKDATPANAALADYDIELRLNSLVDTGCAGADGWWYDTDPAAVPPANRYPFVSLLRVELARGLGRWVFGDPSSGELPSDGTEHQDLMDHYLLDTSFSPPRNWVELFWNERDDSARNDPHLVWSGPNVAAAAAGWLDPAMVLQVHGAHPATFEARKGPLLGARPPRSGTLGGVAVFALDATSPETDACEPLTNAAELAGRVAVIDRGTCTFVQKALAAQNAGAIAVLIANDLGTARPTPIGGSDPAIVIPVLGITPAAADHLWFNPGPHLVSIGYDETTAMGTTDGMLRMVADVEPPTRRSITRFPTYSVPMAMQRYSFDMTQTMDDLSFALLRDIGWPVRADAPNAAPYLDIAATFQAVAGQPSTLTELWFGDVDAQDQLLQLVFEASTGTFVLEPDAVVQTAGSGQTTASIEASRAALQAYVARGGVRFLAESGHVADVALTVTIDDNGNSGAGGAKTDTATATIAMQAANAAPSANDRTLATDVDTALAIVLDGSDPDGDHLAFVPTTQPLHGTLDGQLGRYTYTPNAGYEGTDRFRFVALDGVLSSAPATIDLRIGDGEIVPEVFADGFE